MCGVMERYIAEEQERGIITATQKLINAKMTKETIFKIGYAEEEYAKAETAFLQPVE